MIRNWKVDRVSAWLFVPYGLWVAFASSLNLAIALLRGGQWLAGIALVSALLAIPLVQLAGGLLLLLRHSRVRQRQAAGACSRRFNSAFSASARWDSPNQPPSARA